MREKSPKERNGKEFFIFSKKNLQKAIPKALLKERKSKSSAHMPMYDMTVLKHQRIRTNATHQAVSPKSVPGRELLEAYRESRC